MLDRELGELRANRTLLVASHTPDRIAGLAPDLLALA